MVPIVIQLVQVPSPLLLAYLASIRLLVDCMINPIPSISACLQIMLSFDLGHISSYSNTQYMLPITILDTFIGSKIMFCAVLIFMNLFPDDVEETRRPHATSDESVPPAASTSTSAPGDDVMVGNVLSSVKVVIGGYSRCVCLMY